MPRLSAGLLLYHEVPGGDDVAVLLVHPGGPFWRNRDEGAWSIPKGEVEEGEEPSDVARREFVEELGLPVPAGPWTDLGEVVQAGGKRVRAWAVHGEVDTGAARSNLFELEWPPRSGRTQLFPEVDQARWVPLALARHRLVRAQVELLDRLASALDGPQPG